MTLILFLSQDKYTIDYVTINDDIIKALHMTHLIKNREIDDEFISNLLETIVYINNYGYTKCRQFDISMIEKHEYDKLRWFLLMDITKLLSKLSNPHIKSIIIDTFGVPEQC